MTGFCGSEHVGHGPCSGTPKNFSVVPHLRIAGEYCPVSNQNAVTILKTRFFFENADLCLTVVRRYAKNLALQQAVTY